MKWCLIVDYVSVFFRDLKILMLSFSGIHGVLITLNNLQTFTELEYLLLALVSAVPAFVIPMLLVGKVIYLTPFIHWFFVDLFSLSLIYNILVFSSSLLSLLPWDSEDWRYRNSVFDLPLYLFQGDLSVLFASIEAVLTLFLVDSFLLSLWTNIWP